MLRQVVGLGKIADTSHAPVAGQSTAAAVQPVYLEFVIKLPSEAGQAHGNAFPSGNAPSWLVWFWIHRSIGSAYRLRAKRENGCGRNNTGTLQAFFPNQTPSLIMYGLETHDE